LTAAMRIVAKYLGGKDMCVEISVVSLAMVIRESWV